MNTLLSDLKGVLWLMDDELFCRKDQAEHDKRLEAVLKRIEAVGMTLNSDKSEISKTQLKLLGHIIDENRVQAIQQKLKQLYKSHYPRM